MKYEHVELRVNERGHGEVFLNGAPLKGVKAISLKAGVDLATEVTLTLIASLDCDVIADVTYEK